jgi:luciferase family oxidoreductase group 1
VAIPLSILDLVPVAPGQSIGAAVAGSVAVAQAAERSGYQRVWYAEHHNMATIGSSATSVLIAHIASQTSTIRLGAGGVMLPNHAPLVIAEQFGTLASIHPGRIELGLGRAPGTDQVTLRALRRDPRAADSFAQDVLELQGYLGETSRVSAVRAVPGQGTQVPLFLLGSSLFGAQLAAQLGLPYAFASHFAPAALHQAVATYREQFRPSQQLAEPQVLAGVNVVLGGSREEADADLHRLKMARVAALYGRAGQPLTDEQAEAALRAGAVQHVEQMLTYSAVGTADDVRDYLHRFAAEADADELVVVHQATSLDKRLHSVSVTAAAMSD